MYYVILQQNDQGKIPDEGYRANNKGWILQHNASWQHCWFLLLKRSKHSNTAITYSKIL